MTSPVPRIAITCGDPASVSPEIIARLMHEEPELFRAATVIGPESWLTSLPVLPDTGYQNVDSSYVMTPGIPSTEGAKVALAAMVEAARGCKEGRYDAVATGPVSKSWLQRVGYQFPGQTEFFAHEWGGEPSMAFAGERLRLVLATWHIPLAEVPSALTPETITLAVERAAALGQALVGESVRIALCGLNPHAGEGGILGQEEVELIDPVADQLRLRFPGLSKCLPPDTVFFRTLRGEFDVIVALYHDQGLAPLKALEFDQAVNITLGLPWVRTSPDHGTAYDLVGKEIASPHSFAHAIRLARRLGMLR